MSFELVRRLLRPRAPRSAANVTVGGIQGPVRIARDDFGVPYIEAEHANDAYYGLGWCHAIDRTFQLELLLRVVRGTTAELLGADALPIDRLSRRLGFARAGERQFAFCTPAIQHQLRAYCRGIRAAVRSGRARGPELRLLGSRPSEWEPYEVLGLLDLLCFALSSNWDMELARFRILIADGPDALRALEPGGRETDRPLLRDVDASPLEELDRELHRLRDLVGGAGGSNAWAIAGERTATGRPLLANDPHLDPALPCAWYLAHLRAPGMRVVGASFVGVPAIGAGHNEYGAWGLTAAHVDNTDLFVERIAPDGRHVLGRDGWERCPVVHATIAVRGGAPVEEAILQTRRGPILESFDGPDGERLGLSVAATFLAPRGYRGFLEMHLARSFDDVRAAFGEGTCSAAGVVWAGTDGTIASLLAAEVPGRMEGSGFLPGLGWEERGEWHDRTRPANSLHEEVNPIGGHVVLANARPEGLAHRLECGVDFLDGHRHETIASHLSARGGWTLDATAELQLDVHTPLWTALRDRVIEASAQAHDPRVRAAHHLLASWDGRCDVDSQAATLFAWWMSAMADQLVDAHASAPSRDVARGQALSPITSVGTLMMRRPGHLVRIVQEGGETAFGMELGKSIRLGLAVAWTRVEAAFGPPGPAWAWGQVRPLVLRHPLAELPAAGRLFRLDPIPVGGDTASVAQATVDLRDPARGPVGIATLRMRVDVGAWENSRWALVHGQSGNPLSPHYNDQIPAWVTNAGIPIAFGDDAVRRVTSPPQVLVPDRRPPRNIPKDA